VNAPKKTLYRMEQDKIYGVFAVLKKNTILHWGGGGGGEKNRKKKRRVCVGGGGRGSGGGGGGGVGQGSKLKLHALVTLPPESNDIYPRDRWLRRSRTGKAFQCCISHISLQHKCSH